MPRTAGATGWWEPSSSISGSTTGPMLRSPERSIYNPNDADVIAHRTMMFVYTERREEALESMKRAMRLNPHCPWWYFWLLGWAERMAGNPERAIAAIERIGSPIPECRLITALSHLALGQEADARAEAEAFLRLVPDFRLGQ